MSNNSSPCDTCAFGESGGAADEPRNRLVGVICALSARPFFCHHDRDGNEYDWRSPTNRPLGPLPVPPNQRRVCVGWKREVARLASRGAFTWDATAKDILALRRYQQFLGKEAILRLDEYLDEENHEQKADALVRLENCLRVLRRDEEYEEYR